MALCIYSDGRVHSYVKHMIGDYYMGPRTFFLLLKANFAALKCKFALVPEVDPLLECDLFQQYMNSMQYFKGFFM